MKGETRFSIEQEVNATDNIVMAGMPNNNFLMV